jgi:hypothetical protein
MDIEVTASDVDALAPLWQALAAAASRAVVRGARGRSRGRR